MGYDLTRDVVECGTIIDVRTEDEVEEDGLFEGAIHIPLDKFADHLDFIETLEFPLIMYCRSGNRSSKALSFLEENGFGDVYNGINKDNLADILSEEI